MNLVTLSDEDFDAVYECFVDFHEEYTSFGRIYELGEGQKVNNSSNRPLTQASLR